MYVRVYSNTRDPVLYILKNYTQCLFKLSVTRSTVDFTEDRDFGVLRRKYVQPPQTALNNVGGSKDIQRISTDVYQSLPDCTVSTLDGLGPVEVKVEAMYHTIRRSTRT